MILENKHCKNECVYKMLKSLGPANIVEKSDIGMDLNRCCEILKSLKINFEWKWSYNNNVPDTTFIRGYDDINFLQVHCPTEKLLLNLARVNKMRAFL